MIRVRLTSKRQATFPKQVCESMGLKAGDELILKPLPAAKGQPPGWVLEHPKAETPEWFGSLRPYAAGKSSDWEDVRAGIARGWSEGDS